jgi:putative Mg2+ transporter-C (MgtC) family protein
VLGLRLLFAAVLGGAIGLEHEVHGQVAGTRRHALVATGAALYTEISAWGFSDFTAGGSASAYRIRPGSRRRS